MGVPYKQMEERPAETSAACHEPPPSPKATRDTLQGRGQPGPTDYDAPLTPVDAGPEWSPSTQYLQRRHDDIDDDDDDVMVLPGGCIQAPDNQDRVEPELCPLKPLLPSWPLHLGVAEIALGLLAAGFGACEMFLVPALVNPCGAFWSLSPLNSYGAALWCGTLLILCGSLAVRVSKTKSLLSVSVQGPRGPLVIVSLIFNKLLYISYWLKQHFKKRILLASGLIRQFYVLTLVTCHVNCALLIVMLYYSTKLIIVNKDSCSVFEGLTDYCDREITNSLCEQVFKKLNEYSWVSMLSILWCVFGLIPLVILTVKYFWPVMFGRVNFLRTITGCCRSLFTKQTPSNASSVQSVYSDTNQTMCLVI